MVTILARINVDGAYPFVKPVWTGRKLKPGRVILNGVETQRDDIRYYLRYSAGGKQVTEPAGVHPLDAVTKRDKKESLLRTEAARGAVSSPVLQIVAQRASEGDSTPLETAVETYLEGLRDTSLHPDLKPHTIAGYAHTLGQFKSHCHKSLEAITREDVWKFRSWLMNTAKQENGKPYALRTANNKTGEVVSFLNASGRPGLLTEADWRKLKQGGSTREPYSKAEIAKMRKLADVDERDLLEFLVGTGMRKKQCMYTKWSDIDFLNRRVRVPEGGKRPNLAVLTRSEVC